MIKANYPKLRETLHHKEWACKTLLCCALLCRHALRCFALPVFSLLYFALRYFALLCFVSLLCFVLLCFVLIYVALLCFVFFAVFCFALLGFLFALRFFALLCLLCFALLNNEKQTKPGGPWAGLEPKWIRSQCVSLSLFLYIYKYIYGQMRELPPWSICCDVGIKHFRETRPITCLITSCCHSYALEKRYDILHVVGSFPELKPEFNAVGSPGEPGVRFIHVFTSTYWNVWISQVHIERYGNLSCFYMCF